MVADIYQMAIENSGHYNARSNPVKVKKQRYIQKNLSLIGALDKICETLKSHMLSNKSTPGI